MLAVLPVALVLILAWIAWRSRERHYRIGTCCVNAQWPPDDLTGGEQTDAPPAQPVAR